VHKAHSLLKKTRFRLVLQLFFLMLCVFTLTRLFLLFLSSGDIDLTLANISGALAIGTVYDAAFVSYALIPCIIFLFLVPDRLWGSRANRYLLQAIVFCTAYVLGFIAVAEYLFWDEFHVRFNFISVDYLIYTREVTDNISESYPLKSILFSIAVFALAVQLYMYKKTDRLIRVSETVSSRAIYTFILILFPVVSFNVVGQGLRDYTDNRYYAELASNGPYQFFSAFRNNELEYGKFYATLDDESMATRLAGELDIHTSNNGNMFDIHKDIKSTGDERRMNIMLVMVESLSAKYLGSYGNEDNLTPFLDEHAKKSVWFKRFYATGTRTTRGLEAVTLSIPPTPGRSIVKRVGRESGMWSLGNVLKDKGYTTRFLYGGRGYFDNMNSFFSGNGYDITDQSSVPDEEIGFANAWGMSDEDLYAQAIKKADEAYAGNKPFFFHLMTTSNHRPYTYPAGRIDIPSGDGREGAVKYTDWALQGLFQRAEGKPWFDNTLFVIVADHCAGSAGKVSLPLEKYHIPLFIYSPKNITPAEVDTLSSQIDLAPTLLAMMHMNYSSAAFGRDILSTPPDKSRALIANYQHLGMYDGHSTAILSPVKHISRQDRPESKNPVTSEIDSSSPLSKRVISYYQGASKVYDEKLNAWEKHRRPQESDAYISGNL